MGLLNVAAERPGLFFAYLQDLRVPICEVQIFGAADGDQMNTNAIVLSNTVPINSRSSFANQIVRHAPNYC